MSRGRSGISRGHDFGAHIFSGHGLRRSLVVVVKLLSTRMSRGRSGVCGGHHLGRHVLGAHGLCRGRLHSRARADAGVATGNGGGVSVRHHFGGHELLRGLGGEDRLVLVLGAVLGSGGGDGRGLGNLGLVLRLVLVLVQRGREHGGGDGGATGIRLMSDRRLVVGLGSLSSQECSLGLNVTLRLACIVDHIVELGLLKRASNTKTSRNRSRLGSSLLGSLVSGDGVHGALLVDLMLDVFLGAVTVVVHGRDVDAGGGAGGKSAVDAVLVLVVGVGDGLGRHLGGRAGGGRARAGAGVGGRDLDAGGSTRG